MIKCRFCNSENVIKYGFRKNKKKGKTQKYLCRSCDNQFTPNEGFLHTSNTKDIITVALDLYFKGLSLRKIKDHLIQFYNTKVSHTTIYYWIRNYSLLINSFLDTIKPISSSSWGTDESGLYFKNHLHWLWGIIDNETRFLIALQLTKFRYVPEDNVFTQSKLSIRRSPKFIFSDGFKGYEKMIKNNYPNAEHIIIKGIADRGLNNTTERLWSNVKERYKVMRGFKSFKSGNIILSGWRSYYNFIRPHLSLGGKTPAEFSGIDLNLRNNRWQSLIQKSVESEKNVFLEKRNS